MTNFNGVSAYQQTNQTWNRKTDSTKNTKTDSTKEDTDNQVDEKEYVEITADSMEELVDQVSFYAYDSLSGKVLTDSEKQVGQKIDFRG